VTKSDEEVLMLQPELLLAAILAQVGKVTMPLETLLKDYYNYQVEIDQDKEDHISFSLVLTPEVDSNE